MLALLRVSTWTDGAGGRQRGSARKSGREHYDHRTCEDPGLDMPLLAASAAVRGRCEVRWMRVSDKGALGRGDDEGEGEGLSQGASVDLRSVVWSCG